MSVKKKDNQKRMRKMFTLQQRDILPGTRHAPNVAKWAPRDLKDLEPMGHGHRVQQAPVSGRPSCPQSMCVYCARDFLRAATKCFDGTSPGIRTLVVLIHQATLMYRKFAMPSNYYI